MFTTVAVPPMLDDLIDVSRRWRPDLFVHEESEHAAPLVASVLDVPCVTHSWAAPARPQVEQDIVAGLTEPIWARHHAGPPRLSGVVYLDVCPPPFQTDSIHSVSGVRSMRPVLFDGPTTSPPAWLGRIERPAAYVSFGTVTKFCRPEVLQSAMDAASQGAASVVVTTGPNGTDVMDPPSASVFVEQYVPQSVVLPHVDVVVSHGGAGTTLGALQNGLPHVVIPQGGMSQLRNAQRIDALGIGIHVIHTDDKRSLRAAIYGAMTEVSYSNQAALTRGSLLDLPSPEAVLSQLAAELT